MKRTNELQYAGTGEEPLVLLVNRNQRNLDLLTSFLRREGYDTATARNREEFDQVLKKPQEIGATLLDIAGFDSSVWEQCGLLSSKEIPFVVIAPHQNAVIQQTGLAHGAQDVVVKPLALNKLRAILDRLLEEFERKKREERQRQAQKMEMLGGLTSGIVHDFNNILTAIQVSANQCLTAVSEEDALYPHLARIRDNTERAARLSRQLLSFARKQPLALQSLDLNEVIRTILDLLKTMLGAQIAIEFHPDPTILPVIADRTQLEQVLLNLGVNARDAMPSGGQLSIQTRQVTLDVAQHPDAPPGPYVLLTVKDTGSGMSEQVQARLFEPFFTTKEVGKGTGLGLPVVYGIVAQHHGFIEVDSVVGVGTGFSIYLPASTLLSEDSEPAWDEHAAEAFDRQHVSLDKELAALADGYDRHIPHDGQAQQLTLDQHSIHDGHGGHNGYHLYNGSHKNLAYDGHDGRDGYNRYGRQDSSGMNTTHVKRDEHDGNAVYDRSDVLYGDDGDEGQRAVKKLLLVEDDDDLRLLMCEFLEEEGYTVLVAASAEEGLQAFHEHASSLTLVISDFNLPGMQGRDFYDLAHQLAPDMRFLFVSGFSENQLKKNLPSDPHVAILLKPFDVQELISKVAVLTQNSVKEY